MGKETYIEKAFRRRSLEIIEQANDIIVEYEEQGFTLTLRQLYYQFVSRDLLENTQAGYDKLGSIINDARLAGLIDWHAIEDRTRFLRGKAHWNHPTDILRTAATQFTMDMWQGQNFRPEVWIEKDALIGVIEKVCREYDVPYFSCRGYVSQSEMWRAGQRFLQTEGQIPIIFHLGDHDPSGMDMTGDITRRLELFTEGLVSMDNVWRIALNMNQVEQYGPPPNPAKITDSRAVNYIARHGDHSWELDALEPSVISKLIKDSIEKLIDWDLWRDTQTIIENGRQKLLSFVDNWE